MRFKISFELVEDTDKQERDFGVSNEQLKKFSEQREQIIREHIDCLKTVIENEFTYADYEWVENLEIEEVKNDTEI